MLDLPKEYLTKEQREYIESFQKTNSRRYLLPSAEWKENIFSSQIMGTN